MQERLRKALSAAGYELLQPDPRPFFAKFDAVNRENWTGQKLDVTNWEDETAFVQWIVTALTVLATLVIIVLMAIIGVGIMNVMWISIRERTREIGTLRAVGMQRSSVLAMFVAEGTPAGGDEHHGGRPAGGARCRSASPGRTSRSRPAGSSSSSRSGW